MICVIKCGAQDNKYLSEERQMKTKGCVRCKRNMHCVKETQSTHVGEMNEMKRKQDMKD